MSQLSVIYITFDSRNKAKQMAKILLNKKLIACANIYEIDSLYNWESKVVDETEFVLWAKTTSNNITKIENVVEENHDYETPCIANFEFKANASYAKWLKSEST